MNESKIQEEKVNKSKHTKEKCAIRMQEEGVRVTGRRGGSEAEGNSATGMEAEKGVQKEEE